MPHIKCLHEDKVKHNEVLTLLKFCCEKNGKLQNERGGYEAALILAVKNDIPEVKEHITRPFPLSIWYTKDDNNTLYLLAIMNRCENAYKFLVHEETYHRDLHHCRVSCIFDDNNLLHLTAKLAPQNILNKVNGATLQMQKELQWFQEVSKLVSLEQRKSRNNEIETPMMVFSKQHEDLRQKGEDWMKSTANSYTITVALIITIVFQRSLLYQEGTMGRLGKQFIKKPELHYISCLGCTLIVYIDHILVEVSFHPHSTLCR
ncbi:hypothetical protein Hdeb2414_s0015g00438681 [Helianthus debilis subsp. tardiflorus]